MKIRNRIFAGLLSFAVVAGELLPVYAAGNGEEAVYGEAETVEVSVSLIQEGAFPAAEEYDGADRSGEADGAFSKEAEEAVVAALKKRASSINVSAYNVSVSNVAKFYQGIVNAHPDLFYVTGDFTYSPGSGTVSTITPKYASKYDNSHVETFYATVDSILAEMGSDWPDLEKVLFLHDYLVTHCDYQKTKPYSKYDAYNALVEGEAVCQGYTEAFEYLLQRIGVDGQIVSSAALNHAWNVLQLDGEWYYIDTTWDDPTNKGGFYCGHKNFLRSLQGMVESGHDSDDWVGAEDYADIDATIPGGTAYDGYFWSETTSVLPLAGQKTLTISGKTGSLYDFSTKSSKSHTVKAGTWYVWGDKTRMYSGDFAQVAALGDKFYYSTQDKIYSFELDGTQEKVYSLDSTEIKLGYIYGLGAGEDGRSLEFQLKTAPDQETVYTGRVQVVEVQDLSAIKLDQERVVIRSADEQVRLTATVYDADGKEDKDAVVSFESADPGVVTVSEEGVLTAEADGRTVVTARSGELSAECRVTVRLAGGTHSALDPLPYDDGENVFYLVKGQSINMAREGKLTLINNPDGAVSLSKKGIVTAKKEGTARLKIEEAVEGGEAVFSEEYDFYVVEPALNENNISLLPGEAYALGIGLNCHKEDLSEKYPLYWYSSAPSVVSIIDGEAVAIAKGSATLTAWVNGKTYKLKVKVADTRKADLSVKEDNKQGTVLFDTIRLQPLQNLTLKMKGLSLKNRDWDSADDPMEKKTEGKKSVYENRMLRIDANGKLTAIGSGSCTLRFVDEKETEYLLPVTVAEPQEQRIYLNVGKSAKLRYYGVKNREVSFKSDDTSVASADEKGTVKGNAAGMTVIRFTYEGFEFRTCVYVENAALEEEAGVLRSVKADSYTLDIKKGETYGLRFRTEGAYALYQPVLFKSSKNKIAFVDENGLIEARAEGSAVISAKVNGKKITVKVNVVPGDPE
ncbi:MAG: Ig-like domain-containing protein [Lachnospiraceae bacterium]|nr:Ig-like domain-containing protein [Lachnospiraceae bacterium]